MLTAPKILMRHVAGVVDEMTVKLLAMSENAKILQMTGPKLRERCFEIANEFDLVAGKVRAMQALRADARFGVALAQLQSESTGTFLVAVIDGLEQERVASDAIPQLSKAMRVSLDYAVGVLARDRERAARLRTELRSADRMLAYLKLLLGVWGKRMTPVGNGGLVAQLNQGVAELERVDALAKGIEKLVDSTIGFDQEKVLAGLDVVEGISAR